MEKRTIGSLEVSVVGLGCNNFGWRIGEEETARVVDAALDAGINFLDTANSYAKGQSEEYLGRALRGRWNRVVIATKFGSKMDEGQQGAKPAYLRQAVEESLRRLGVERIDLYQLHKPDAETPIRDTLEALDGLVKAGKVREIGCSNFTGEMIREAESAVRPGAARFVSVQNEYSLLHRDVEKDVLPECAAARARVSAVLPAGERAVDREVPPWGGAACGEPGTGRMGAEGLHRGELGIADGLRTFAEAQGHTLLELAFSWLASRPAVASVIAGARSPEQARANARAAEWKLTEAELVEVDRILAPHTKTVLG